MTRLTIEDDEPVAAPIIDFEADAKPKPLGATQLRDVTLLANQLLHEKAREAFYLEKLKDCREKINKLEAEELPTVMFSVGLSEFTTSEGAKIEVRSIVSATLTEPKRLAGIAWLKEHGHSGIVKHDFKVELPKDVVKNAQRAAALKLELEKLGLGVVDKETVHPQTLGAWAREMLSDPTTAGIPLDLLGIYVGKRATVKQPAITD